MTETFDEDALFIYSQLEVKTHFFKPQNISKKFFNPEETDAVEPLVLAKNKYDIKIFEEANLRHKKEHLLHNIDKPYFACGCAAQFHQY